MAEGIMERAVLEALAAAGVPTALVDGTAPFRVRWANAAFARSLRLGAAAEGQPLLELLGGNRAWPRSSGGSAMRARCRWSSALAVARASASASAS